MKSRRQKGATLGLVAVSVLVIIVIGVCCYFLAKLAGGGREVTNSTDAGALAISKAALRSNAVSASLPAPDSFGFQDFTGCGDPNAGNNVTLFTYNRCVAEALLVTLNVSQPNNNTPGAIGYANTVWSELQQIGSSLSGKLQTQSTLNSVFDTVANRNSLKDFGNNHVNEVNYKWAYMRQGGSTNVWFSKYTFSGVDASGATVSYLPVPNGLVYSGTLDRPAPASSPSGNCEYSPYTDMGSGFSTGYNSPYQNKYMAGYQAITVPGPINHTFTGVPVFPTQKPHLVSLKEFNDPAQNYTDPNGWAPPNTFQVTTNTQDSKTGNFGGAVACAIVGAVNNFGAANPTASCDFVAEFPMGYIMIANDAPAGGAPPAWGGPGDGTNNIFNWELNPVGGGPGVNLTNSGTGEVFFQDTGSQATTVQQWVDYNNAGDPVAPATWNDSTNGNNPTTGAPTGSLAGIYVTTDGTNYAPATTADMMGLTNKGTNCLQDLINTNMGYPGTPTSCGNALNAFSGAYGRTMGGGMGAANSTMQQYWSNVDQIKKDITGAFNTPYVGVTAPGGKSGLGEYKVTRDPSTGMWPDEPWNAGNAPPLEKANATVMDLLTQVGGCATTSVVQDIWQRCNEIAPGISYNDVVSLLSSPSATLTMGQTLYIRRINASDMNSKLTIAAAPPVGLTSSPTPDGNPNIGTAVCDSGAYDLYQGGFGLIDSKAGPAGKGDNNLHDQPYTVVSSDLSATDHANFIVSSGAHGMLGKLEFYQTTTGAGAFSRPN